MNLHKESACGRQVVSKGVEDTGYTETLTAQRWHGLHNLLGTVSSANQSIASGKSHHQGMEPSVQG